MAINIEDLRRRARRRLPRMVFDYIDGGAADERTLHANESAYADILLRPRSGVATPAVDLNTTVLGHELSLPLLLAPVGSSRMFWPRGEARAAAAAGAAGTGYILSTLSGTPVEEVRAAAGDAPVWYQLYLAGGRDAALAAMERAAGCGCSALVVTVDTPAAGNRERDLRNGAAELLSRNPLKMLPHAWQVAVKPRWLLDFYRDGGIMSFPNVMLPEGPMPYQDIGAQLGASVVSWADLQWIAEAWPGHIIVKGVHTADDARQAVDHGAAAVVVSNHGGRQLDGVAPSIRVLPEVVAAVGAEVEVLVDGGIRRGSDIAKALALGARAVLTGRAYAYGLAAAGEAGVSRAIEILREELILTMKLLGCASVHSLDQSLLDVPTAWTA